MTMTREQIEALLDGTTPGPWAMETVRTSCGTCHRIGPFPRPAYASKPEGWACVYDDYPPGKGSPDLLSNASLIAAAPDLARQLLAAMDRLADADMAQAALVERAADTEMIESAIRDAHDQHSVLADYARSVSAAIRRLASDAGVKDLTALRAERDAAVDAEAQRDAELQEQHRVRKAWADRALAAEADNSRLAAELAEAKTQIVHMQSAWSKDAAENEELRKQVAALQRASGVIVGEPLRGDETFVEMFEKQLEGWNSTEEPKP